MTVEANNIDIKSLIKTAGQKDTLGNKCSEKFLFIIGNLESHIHTQGTMH